MILTNLGRQELIDTAIEKEDSILSEAGALCCWTGDHTGRSPNAKYIVEDSLTRDLVDWENNQKIEYSSYIELKNRFLEFKSKLSESSEDSIFLQNVTAVRDPAYSLPVNVWTEYAKHSLFARNMFIPAGTDNFKAQYNVYHFPSLLEEPTVVISLEERVILISGTLYSGEIKKSVFTVLNYWFPIDWNFLPMHCSVNTSKDRDNPTIFFGLSGTGKTTLSSDANRILIGDDEHGWTDRGLVNFEGGCYAKTIRLSKDDEPQIWNASNRKGSILENVVIHNGIPDFDDDKYTQNSRSSYPTSFIDNADKLGYVNLHPRNIVMLTCDSFGVLPPVAKLRPEEAVKQFLLGYTAKVAGTEAGVTEPVATFSPCFGLPFMPLPPAVYGKILKQKINEHSVTCWLVNTGWTGGSYGIGKRMPISITRMIIDRILDGSLAKQSLIHHAPTGLYIPMCSDIDQSILIPEKGWDSIAAYRRQASKLIALFEKHQ